MTDEGSITQWLAQLKTGDQDAAERLWQRYYQRLVALALTKLDKMPRSARDEEDVALSAFNCFFRGVQTGRFPKLDDRTDLWRILVTLTANKAINQLKYQGRQKRRGGLVRGASGFGELPSKEGKAGVDQVAAGEPTPDFAAMVAEQCSNLLRRLDNDTLRNIAVSKMEGYTNQEIAERLGCKLRTVERKLQMIRKLWSE